MIKVALSDLGADIAAALSDIKIFAVKNMFNNSLAIRGPYIFRLFAHTWRLKMC